MKRMYLVALSMILMIVVAGFVPERSSCAETPKTAPVGLAPEQQSEFEQFVSERVEVTEKQFEILRKNEKIVFSSTLPSPPAGKIVVPVRVMGHPQAAQPAEIEAGFVTGNPEEIAEAFRLVGIRSRYAIFTELKQFGYDLFRMPPETFAPADQVPVGPDYVIGPGDQIRVSVWGKFEGEFSLEVGRDGNVSIPKVGTIGVA